MQIKRKCALAPHLLVDHHSSAFALGISTPSLTTPLETAREYVSRWANLYSRMDEVLAFKSSLNYPDWLTLLGEERDRCDNISHCRILLERILKTTGPGRHGMNARPVQMLTGHARHKTELAISPDLSWMPGKTIVGNGIQNLNSTQMSLEESRWPTSATEVSYRLSA
jgi:hypothetical protein